ncbi:hypothetical protein [Kitasatospora sp. NPDC056531]
MVGCPVGTGVALALGVTTGPAVEPQSAVGVWVPVTGAPVVVAVGEA